MLHEKLGLDQNLELALGIRPCDDRRHGTAETIERLDDNRLHVGNADPKPPLSVRDRPLITDLDQDRRKTPPAVGRTDAPSNRHEATMGFHPKLLTASEEADPS